MEAHGQFREQACQKDSASLQLCDRKANLARDFLSVWREVFFVARNLATQPGCSAAESGNQNRPIAEMH
jgi:hypothetical protein